MCGRPNRERRLAEPYCGLAGIPSELGGPGATEPPRPGGRPLGVGAFGATLGNGTGSAPSSGTPIRAGLAGARLGRANQRFELPIGQLYAVEFVVELAGVGPQILLILIGIEQGGKPIQSDDAVDPRGIVDPPEGVGRREIDPFAGDRDQAAPRRAVQQGIIKASLLGDDDCRVPVDDLVARHPRQLAAAEPGGDIDDPRLVDGGHRLRAAETGFEPVRSAAIIDDRPLVGRRDQQSAAQRIDGVIGIFGQIVAAFGGAEQRTDDPQSCAG